MNKIPRARVGKNIPVLEDLRACHQMWEKIWH